MAGLTVLVNGGVAPETLNQKFELATLTELDWRTQPWPVGQFKISLLPATE